MPHLAGILAAADPVQPAYSTGILLTLAVVAVLALLFLIVRSSCTRSSPSCW